MSTQPEAVPSSRTKGAPKLAVLWTFAFLMYSSSLTIQTLFWCFMSSYHTYWRDNKAGITHYFTTRRCVCLILSFVKQKYEKNSGPVISCLWKLVLRIFSCVSPGNLYHKLGEICIFLFSSKIWPSRPILLSQSFTMKITLHLSGFDLTTGNSAPKLPNVRALEYLPSSLWWLVSRWYTKGGDRPGFQADFLHLSSLKASDLISHPDI